MKNLRKLSKGELKSINGGILNCPTVSMYDSPPPKCPCNYHTQELCNGNCIPKGSICI